jgi:pimeloyl-ACP methyl ester carboxylesterase
MSKMPLILLKYCLRLLLAMIVFFLCPDAQTQTKHTPRKDVEPIPITFESQGTLIRGLFYQASRKEKSPTVVLCPGFPGNNTDVLGLGAILRKEDINALVFNYRGTWGSEGNLSIPNSLGDVIAALRFVKSSLAVRDFNIDTSDVTILGYSFGGGLALLGSLSDTTIRKVIDVAGGDLTEIARMMQTDEDYKKAVENLLEMGISTSGFKSLNAKDMFADVLMDMDKYDLVKHAEQLSYKDILLIGGWSDQANTIEHHILPLYRALQIYGAKQLEIEVFSTDHSFKNVRDQLTQRILAWLKRVR